MSPISIAFGFLSTLLIFCSANTANLQMQPVKDQNPLLPSSSSVLNAGIGSVEAVTKRTTKRGLDFGFVDDTLAAAWVGSGPWKPSIHPAKAASIIQQAKQASASVLIAQQQVQAAKDNVLYNQKIANEKHNQAQIAAQNSDLAAQNVVLAQQKLAAARSNYAQLQLSAKLAAAEISRAEMEATKLSAAKDFANGVHVPIPYTVAPWDVAPWGSSSPYKPLHLWG